MPTNLYGVVTRNNLFLWLTIISGTFVTKITSNAMYKMNDWYDIAETLFGLGQLWSLFEFNNL